MRQIEILDKPNQISMKQELMRKGIHIASLSIPIFYIWNTRKTMLWIFVPLTLVCLVFEYSRFFFPAVQNFISRYFGAMMREHELKAGKLTGATFVIISALLCVLIFPKNVMIPAFAVLIISDTCAALIGRRYGRHKLFNKSFEGSGAFAVSAWLVTALFGYVLNAPQAFYYAGCIASVVAAFAEAISWGVNIDDNFTIPISYGSVIWGILSLLNLPEIKSFLNF